MVVGLSRSLDLDNVKTLKGIFPEDTASQIEDRRFRLCHIDVDTYESAKQSLEWVWPRISVGGVVVFDDYGFIGCEGVTKYVNDIASRRDSLFLHNLNGHGILVKLN